MNRLKAMGASPGFFKDCRGTERKTPFPATRKESRIFKQYLMHSWKTKSVYPAASAALLLLVCSEECTWAF